MLSTTQLHHGIHYTITNQVPDPGIPIVWITVTTNWKKNTKKNTMKLNELSLLKKQQENKYYLIHRGKKHVQKRVQFYYFKKSNTLLLNHWPTQLLAGGEYTLLKASIANASSSRYSMWTVTFLQQRGSRLQSSEMWHFVVWCEGTSTSEQHTASGFEVDGGNKHLQNIGTHLQNYMMSHPRRP